MPDPNLYTDLTVCWRENQPLPFIRAHEPWIARVKNKIVFQKNRTMLYATR